MDYRNDLEEINRLSDLDFCILDWENKVIYDNWGMGMKVRANSFFVSYHPLQGKTFQKTGNLMNNYVSGKVLFAKDLEAAVREYEVPEMNKSSNFSDWDNDLENYSGKYLVWPSGYFGIFERSYSLMGREEDL